jgi:hypothetical protein
MNVRLKGELNEVDKILVKRILSQHFLFKDKSIEIIDTIIEKIEIKKFDINTVIENIDSFYIIT